MRPKTREELIAGLERKRKEIFDHIEDGAPPSEFRLAIDCVKFINGCILMLEGERDE